MQKNKKRQYTNDDFSDQQVYHQIKDSIRQIRQQRLKPVQQDHRISFLYQSKKNQIKRNRRKINQQLKPKPPQQPTNNDLDSQGIQQGQIKKTQIQPQPPIEQDAPSINQLGDRIRPITIARNKLTQLLKSRKFQDIIKGCFVRYKSENSNSYMLALVVGIFEGQKQYILNNIKTKTLLRLQQSSSQIIKLSLDHVSNQHPPGSLQISKWLQTNRNKIPQQKQLKQKLQQLNNLIHGKISSQQIDKNLLKQARRVSDDKAQGPQNISQLIFFMRNHIHDLIVTIQQLQADKSQQSLKIQQKKQYDTILQKLITKQSEYKKKLQKIQKQKKQRLNNKYINCNYQYKKQDKIKQIYHQMILTISSFQGYNRIKKSLIEAHQAFDIDVDI